jgi:xylulokinase
MDNLAAQVPPVSEGLVFLPWVWGERSPVDDDNVRGGFVNLGLNHTKGHMIRAMLEGIGYHLRWIFGAIERAGVHVEEAHVIGGGAVSPVWLQILADTTNTKLVQVEQPLDACARGAALTAAVGLGLHKDFAEVEKVIKLTGAEFTPNPQNQGMYDDAYAKLRFLYKPLSDLGNKRVPPVDDRKRFSLKGAVESFVIKQWIKSQMAKKDK